jgi:hypothetical protein
MSSPAIVLEADRKRFEGMLPREIAIWKMWLRKNESRFSRYHYNVRVGQGVDPGDSYSFDTRRNAIINSRKRLDVLAVQGNRVTIIEVEENPGAAAPGQLITYEVLWRETARLRGPSDVDRAFHLEGFFPRDVPLDADPNLLIVCARANPDMRMVIERAGIGLDVIPLSPVEIAVYVKTGVLPQR